MNKKLLGVIIAVAVIVVLTIVLWVTFTIRNITLDTTSNLKLTDEETQELINDSGIKLKSSIFSVDENIVIQNIEKSHPSLKVISVERKFPNTVCVNITNRTPVYSVGLSTGARAILDRELKIIDVVESDEDIDYITRVTGYTINGTIQKGGMVTGISFLKEITAEAEKMSFVNQRMSSFIPTIVYLKADTSKEDEVSKILLQTKTGVSLVIREDVGSMGKYFNYAYTKYYTELTEHQRSEGYVYLTDDNVWTWSATLE